MRDEPGDVELAEVLKAARPEPRPGWEERIVTRLAQRGVRVHARRRWVAVAVGAAAALVALGVLAPPWSGEESTWNRVLAAAEKASSLHVRANVLRPEGKVTSESWMAKGFSRHEDWRDGELKSVGLTIEDDVSPRRLLRYSESERGRRGMDLVLPPRPPLDLTRSIFASGDALVKAIEGWASSDEVESRTWTKAASTGMVEVVEATRTVRRMWLGSFGRQADIGDRLRVRAEIDPQTDRLLSVAEYRLEDGLWQEVYATELIEYDVPIPGELREFDFPPGTVVERTRWWDGRTDEVLAEAEVDGWNVKVHALDVDLEGNIYLTFSLWTKKRRDLAGWPAAEAIDIKQTRYGRFTTGTVANDYGIIVMRPELRSRPKGGRPPRSATITFWPRLDEDGGGKSVMFRHLPLPPPKPVQIYEEVRY